MKGVLIALLLSFSTLSAFAQFKEGENYDIVAEKATAQPTVTEFFSMFCGHCFQFESLLPDLKAGLKANTKFEKEHVDYIPHDNPEVQLGIVKAYVIISRLGDKGTEIMQYIFNQIHLVNRTVDSVDVIKQMFWEQGVSKADVDRFFSDSEIDKQAVKMARLWQEKKITNVPTLVVNGKYKINMSSVANMDELVKLVNFLVEKK